ncbi:MAG: hypothetical protein Sapg2KO_13740 [Saprospiraceae bacterium]
MRILTTLLFCFLLTNISFGYDDFVDCPEGTRTVNTIPPGGGTPITTCEPCAEGKFQDQTGQSVCNDCPAGRFQDQTGQADCKTCLVGTYQPNPGAESCLPCELGRFQDVEGAIDCKTCPPGTTTRTTGSASQDACVRVDENLPVMNRWGLIALILLVLTAATFLLRRRGLFEK